VLTTLPLACADCPEILGASTARGPKVLFVLPVCDVVTQVVSYLHDCNLKF